MFSRAGYIDQTSGVCRELGHINDINDWSLKVSGWLCGVAVTWTVRVYRWIKWKCFIVTNTSLAVTQTRWTMFQDHLAKCHIMIFIWVSVCKCLPGCMTHVWWSRLSVGHDSLLVMSDCHICMSDCHVCLSVCHDWLSCLTIISECHA